MEIELSPVADAIKYIGSLATVVSSTLWWKASTIEIDEHHPLADRVNGVFLNGIDVLTTYRHQSKWNKWAAFATGVSIAFPWISEMLS
jgi:hypothetical protein